jgi:soluble lytic murein transglycosylase-like protein
MTSQIDLEMAKKAKHFARIIEVYAKELVVRDAATVDIIDLLPAIYKAVPNATKDDIVLALLWPAKHADALKRLPGGNRPGGDAA